MAENTVVIYQHDEYGNYTGMSDIIEVGAELPFRWVTAVPPTIPAGKHLVLNGQDWDIRDEPVVPVEMSEEELEAMMNGEG